MIDVNNFDEIRPYQDQEVQNVIKELIQQDFFVPLIKKLYPETDPERIRHSFSRVASIHDFQTKVIYPILKKLLGNTSDGITFSGFEKLEKDRAHLFISNHHDIVLDPSVLNVLLFEQQFHTTKVAIGDNLLTKNWIKDLARLNKSFIVHRTPPMKLSYYYSHRLSNFIKTSILNENESIWIAQRQGRAKDGNDVTQVSLLKMLAYGGDENKFAYLHSLNFLPLAISYEYDPCDVLKVKELVAKERSRDFQKSAKDDIISMVTGLTGYKGKIHVSLGKPLDKEFDDIMQHETSKEQYSSLAAIIDEQIQSIIKLWPTNYIAYDLLMNMDMYKESYSLDEKQSFLDYVNKRLNSADLNDPESRIKFLSIYANPVKNKIRLTQF
ncbi:MAG: 1-acyl-sn-glycerol-3-phosphate acyltransferase [Cyclobacteriaceae bacterium]|nr:1-acyl-sn-glycerol-3-phosphate acyltransferase [Cyclobacteriaceae bacterium]